MVWCIQRDFLQGKSTQAAVNDALSVVPNPKQDRSIDQVPCCGRPVSPHPVTLPPELPQIATPSPHLRGAYSDV
jgi:hypothetical protein